MCIRDRDRTVERKGPKATSAFLNGVPTSAAKGFANSLGIKIEDLEVKETEKKIVTLFDLYNNLRDQELQK